MLLLVGASQGCLVPTRLSGGHCVCAALWNNRGKQRGGQAIESGSRAGSVSRWRRVPVFDMGKKMGRGHVCSGAQGARQDRPPHTEEARQRGSRCPWRLACRVHTCQLREEQSQWGWLGQEEG